MCVCFLNVLVFQSERRHVKPKISLSIYIMQWHCAPIILRSVQQVAVIPLKQSDQPTNTIKPNEEEIEPLDWLLLGDRQLQSKRDRYIFNLGQKTNRFSFISESSASTQMQLDIFECFTVAKRAETSPAVCQDR